MYRHYRLYRKIVYHLEFADYLEIFLTTAVVGFTTLKGARSLVFVRVKYLHSLMMF